MDPVYVSAIAHVHGEPRALSELDEKMPVDLTLPAHGLQYYRESNQPIWEMAAAVVEQTVGRSPRQPDLLICASENDRSAESLAQAMRRIGLPRIEWRRLAIM